MLKGKIILKDITDPKEGMQVISHTKVDVPLFNQGDKIKWSYQHWLNSKQFTWQTKTGVFIRHVKTKKKYLADWVINKKAVVKFDGNKNNSTVNVSELRHFS